MLVLCLEVIFIQGCLCQHFQLCYNFIPCSEQARDEQGLPRPVARYYRYIQTQDPGWRDLDYTVQVG